MPLSEAAKEHRKAQAKEYYVRNKEKYAVYGRNYYQENKDRRNEKVKVYRHKNRERLAEYKRQYRSERRAELCAKSKAYRLANLEKIKASVRSAYIKRTYGITAQEYDARIAAQNGKCEVCKNKPNGNGAKSKLHLDHCHTTQKIRGMICGNCNAALGMAKDDLVILRALVAYMERYQ